VLVVLLVGCLTPSGGAPAPATGTPRPTGPSTLPDTLEPDVTAPSVHVTDLGWSVSAYAGSVVEVAWSQDVAAGMHVEYSFDKGVWASTPSRQYDAGENTQVVVGIPYGTTAAWRVVVDGAGGASFNGGTLATASWPPGVPIPRAIVDDRALQVPGGQYFLTSTNGTYDGYSDTYWVVIVDRRGRLVWSKKAPDSHWVTAAQLSASGDHLLLDEATAWPDFDAGRGSTVHRTYLDEEIEEIRTPGLHHGFVELPDRTLAWGSLGHGGGEALVEKAPGQLDETVRWTCADGDPDLGARCAANSLYFDATADSYLFSFYTDDTVAEIDRSTGETVWWTGATGSYEFYPRDAHFERQQGVSYTPSGTLLVSAEYGDPIHTWLLEYQVDPALGVLTLVWANDSGVRAWVNGQARRLTNGNTLHVVGSASAVREVAASGDEVWRLEFDDNQVLGGGQFIEDLYDLVKPARAKDR
jgi:hypothetical protein